MFRATYRSSSGALAVFAASGLHTHMVTGRSQVWVGNGLAIPVCYSEITNKMKPCNRIYFSTVHWRLNMFRTAYRPSSGALTIFSASGLHTHVVTGRSQVWVGIGTIPKPVPTQTWLRPVTTYVCKPEVTNTVRSPDDERCAARYMLSLQWTVE
jgi:hypothetical protein